MTMFSSKTGALSIQPTRLNAGKLIDTWAFRSPFKDAAARAIEEKLTAQVYIHKSTTSVYFEAKSPALPGDAISGTDIEKLRAEVEEAFNMQHDALANCKWSDWLEVQVSKQLNPMRGTGIELKMTYTPLKKGIDAAGKEWTVNFNQVAVPFPTPKQAGQEDQKVQIPGLAGYASGRPTDCEFSYIPATPENIAAMEALVARFEALHKAMSSFLSQDTIESSLVDASFTSLLPSS